MRIAKVELDFDEETDLDITGKLIYFAFKDDKPFLWMEHHQDRVPVTRTFVILHTGSAANDTWKHHGTAIGPYDVEWHLYEKDPH